jgi:predicted 3-demethylubiquinone-9 3-methyltransferase (glyoxalase superfamily)
MQKIIPHLWYDKEAKEAAEFYTSVFPESKITVVNTLHDTPSGDCDIVSFTLWGQEFMSISAGPIFKLNPSISFFVNFDPLFFKSSTDPEKAAREKLDQVWNKLAEGGKVMMELGEYPFSKRYGWLADKYGVTWQLMIGKPEGDPRPSIIPSMMFVGKKAGKAEEAINFYLSVFKNSKPGIMFKYPAGSEPDKEGTIAFADFNLDNKWLAAMDSAHEHKFDFNEAVSLLVPCKDQAEIDYFWEKLSSDPKSEQCGWCKDKYGVSWQITWDKMHDIFKSGSTEQIDRLTQAVMPMKKIEVAKLKEAIEGKKLAKEAS